FQQLVVLVGIAVLLSAVNAQQNRNGTLPDVTTVQTDQADSEANSEAPNNPTTFPANENAQLADNLRQEIERRRQERQQRIEELRRQERLRPNQELIDDRRQEMEARRAGRIPAREQNRVLRLRQERLGENAPNDEENEVNGPKQLIPAFTDLIRRIVLIQEPSGNVKLLDLDTDEGRDLIWRVTERVESEEEKAEALRKLKVKLGQL
ncbi:hypothetical protein RP20_CCG007882, partial [Aedes albopictus]